MRGLKKPKGINAKKAKHAKEKGLIGDSKGA